MKRIFLLLLLGTAFFRSPAQQIEWQRCLGGSGFDGGASVQQTADLGYIVAGFTESNDGNVSGNHGGSDYWVVKLDRSGAIQWQRCLGGSIGDWGRSVFQTDDGGYIVAGHIMSFDGDVSCNNGLHDYWIARLDSNGVLLWEHCYGGGYEDEAQEVRQTADGGFIVAGSTISNNSWVSGNHGWYDYWVLKLDSAGNMEWQKCYGGTETEQAFSIDECTGGGYVVAGHAWSNDGNVSGNHGGIDSWVIRIDGNGDILWQRCLGGSASEYAHCVRQTTDGGFIVAGSSHSNDGDVMGNHGGGDCWIVKLDSMGSVDWQQCYGGSYLDFAKSIAQTQDGGYIVAANSESSDGDVSGNHGFVDYWVFKLSPTGQLLWESNFGGSQQDIPYSIRQTADNGYIVAGETNSDNLDVNGNHGTTDFWVVKLSNAVLSSYSGFEFDGPAFEIYPNPVRDAFSVSATAPLRRVTVYDIAGNRLLESTFTGGVAQTRMDASAFPKGVYIVRVRTETYTASQRMIRM